MTYIDWQGIERVDGYQYCYEAGGRIFGPFDKVEDCARQAGAYMAACYKSDSSAIPTPPTVILRPMRLAGKT
jgi:hypothetical protein